MRRRLTHFERAEVRCASGEAVGHRRKSDPAIDSGGADSVTALAIDGSGELLALTRENGATLLRR